MALFDEFLTALRTELKAFVTAFGEEMKEGASQHLDDFVSDSQEDLQRWTKALGNGELTEEEFRVLLESKKNVLEIVALEKIGLAKVAHDRFVNGVMDVTLRTAAKTFLP